MPPGDWLWSPSRLLFYGFGGRGDLATHLHLLSKSRMCGVLLPCPLYTFVAYCLGTGATLPFYFSLLWQPAWCDSHHDGTEWCCKVSTSMSGPPVHAVAQCSEPSWHHSVISQLFCHGSTSYWLDSNSSVPGWVLCEICHMLHCIMKFLGCKLKTDMNYVTDGSEELYYLLLSPGIVLPTI
jgi:hypothetical protein